MAEFAKDTRTSIQKRIEGKVGDVMGMVTKAVEAEFGEGGMDKTNPDHQRRVSRAVGVIVAKSLLAAGIDLHRISSGMAGAGGCLHADLNPPSASTVAAPWVEEDEDENDDGEDEEDDANV